MSTENRIKYTYSHPTKEGVTLEVVGKEAKVEGDTTNIITSESIS